MQLHGKAILDSTLKPEKLDLSGFVPSGVNDPVTKGFLDSEKLTVDPASAPYLQISENKLYLKSLAITDVHVDGTSEDLAAFIAASYANGNEFQEGDTVILTAPADGTKVYLHNGDTTGGAADFTLVQQPNTDAATARSWFSAGSIKTDDGQSGWLLYDAATGSYNIHEFNIQRNILDNIADGSGQFTVMGTGMATYIKLDVAQIIGSGLSESGGYIVLDENYLVGNIVGEYLVDSGGRIDVDFDNLKDQLFSDAASGSSISWSNGSIEVDEQWVWDQFSGGGGINYSNGDINIEPSYIRGLFDGQGGITYDSAAGRFEIDFANAFSAGTGLQYDGMGQYQIDEGVVATKTYVDAAITASLPAPSAQNLNHTPTATTGDGAVTGITLARAPKGRVFLFVNGKLEGIGDGAKTQAAYFSADGGTTAKSYAALAAGDQLIWNGAVAGYDLDANDRVDIFYL